MWKNHYLLDKYLKILVDWTISIPSICSIGNWPKGRVPFAMNCTFLSGHSEKLIIFSVYSIPARSKASLQMSV